MKQWTLPTMSLSGMCEVLVNYHTDINKHNTTEPEQMNKTHNKLNKKAWEDVAKGKCSLRTPMSSLFKVRQGCKSLSAKHTSKGTKCAVFAWL